MAETFDLDLEQELSKHDPMKCSNCGYEGEAWEFNIECPMCGDTEENPNNEYNPEEK